jgi:predicted ATPase
VITRVEANNYRCLRSVDVSLRPFQILVGPNGSGKTAFMDVLSFIRRFVSRNLDAAVKERTEPIGSFHDLVWGRQDGSFSLALEALIPEAQRLAGEVRSSTRLRYDVSFRVDAKPDAAFIEGETVALLDDIRGESLTIAARTHTHAQYVRESGSPHPYQPEINRKTSVLAFLPEPTGFAAGIWFATLLRGGIRDVRLSTEDLHRPSTLEAEKASKVTGANLARSVFELRENSRDYFEAWIRHLRTALPDLETVWAEPWPQGSARYLMLKYQNGIEVPSRVVSDGTLCLLALTILAYMPEPNQLYLIEEPENAVHPTAVETIYQSLSSLYDSQVLMASHSPILLGLAKPEELLCFNRTAEGTEIVPGNEHPALKEWKGEVSISDLFAAGVLG